jgi:hypothetical protein
LQVAQAQFQGDSWNASLVPGTLDGYGAVGNVNPEDLLPVAVYGVETPRKPKAWKELDSPWVGATIPDSRGFGPCRWIPGGDSIVFSQVLDGVRQLASYDIHSGITTTLTSGPVHKSQPSAVRAPDLGNDVVLTARETDDVTPPAPILSGEGSYDKWIGVYRQLNGIWTRIKQIFPPAELPAVDSVEPFVFGEKTYISFLAIKAPNTNPGGLKLGAAVFIASVDPDDDFVREVSAKNETIRSDPEPFATNQAAFIYYTEIMAGSGRIHRCTTGLEAP